MSSAESFYPAHKVLILSIFRYIRTKYHFNEVKFVRSSPYWLVDVYKIGPKFGVPITHTHGLVGCGMEFALKALNAPNYLSFLYTGK